MLVRTKYFGNVDAQESDILVFKTGLPGFEEMRKFILIHSSEEEAYFKWLQSTENPQLAFAVADPFSIVKDYSLDISDNIVKELQIEKAEDVVVLSIMVVPEDLEKMSMNLKAPVIINVKNHKAQQIVLDTDKYTVRHYILEELRRQGVSTDAGSDKKKGPNDSNK